jgi:hypothetical protein
MISIQTADGKMLRDQRGTYLYGPDWEITPSDSAPIRFGLAEMVAYWADCCQFGDYVLWISAN